MSTPAPLSAQSGSAARPQGAPTALRLRLRTKGVTEGFVDGGWWPQSRDLSREVPALVEALRAAGHDVFRISYSLTFWDAAPRKLTVGSTSVRLGGFRTQDPALITLVDTSGWKRLDIVVVPPEADPAFAEQALVMAGLDGDVHHAGEVIAPDDVAVPA
jgi:hypothetical protein